MIKILKTRIEKVEIKITVSFCDICESQLGIIDHKDGSHEWSHEETATVNFNFGYLSDNRDGDQGKFILCQNCAENLYNEMKSLSPHIRLTNYMDDLAEAYAEDALNDD